MKNIIALLLAIIFISTTFSYANSISTNDTKREARDFGKVVISKTDINQEGQTRLFLERCFHPGIGNINKCGGYLYKIDEETGRLQSEKINFTNFAYHDSNTWDNILLPAGRYYLKMESRLAGKNYYAMGEIVIVPFVTNFVHVALE